MPPPRIRHLTCSPSSSFLLLTAPRPCPFLYPPPAALALFNNFQTRNASHATQGRANSASQGPGKRLGLKRAATELVVPGTIIFRQRGTRWFPGENCGMGRDHTIFALEKGYVVYYKAPWKGIGYGGAGRIRAQPNASLGERGGKGIVGGGTATGGSSGGTSYKKFIGVVIERGDTLPYPPGMERKRRLGMVVKPRKDLEQPVSNDQQQDISGLTPTAAGTIGSVTMKERAAHPMMQTKKYQIRESNISIGKLMDKAGLKVRTFKRGDRWLAWRKRAKRVAEAKAQKAQKKARKGKGAARAAASGNLRGKV